MNKQQAKEYQERLRKSLKEWKEFEKKWKYFANSINDQDGETQIDQPAPPVENPPPPPNP